MKLMESFLMLYFLLDQCYDVDHGDDGDNVLVLGSFLGDINPTIWSDGYPMDQAVYQDWIAQNDISSLNQENIIDAILKFLQFYENRGFYFSGTKDILQGPLRTHMIAAAKERTQQMYEKYHYRN